MWKAAREQKQGEEMTIKKILLDVDHVLLDWCGHALSTFRAKQGKFVTKTDLKILHNSGGKGPDAVALFGDRNTLNKHIEDMGVEFWSTIPKLPWADSLVKNLKDYALTNEFTLAFVTSPSYWCSAASPRMEYLQREWPKVPIVITEEKHLLASNRSILIDDSNNNCDKFVAAGGNCIRIKNNYLYPVVVEDVLKIIKNIRESWYIEI